MASDIDSTSNEDADLRLKWSGRWTLAHRILALNLITILLVALSTLYLDVFRNRLSKERVRQTRIEATATALAIDAAGPEDREPILATVSRSTGSRLRMFGPDGTLVAESGIHNREDVKMLRDKGIDCFLVGEAFMRAADPGTELRKLFDTPSPTHKH